MMRQCESKIIHSLEYFIIFLLVMYVNTTSFLNRQQVFNEVYRIYAICNDITNTVSNHGSFPTLMIPLLLKSLTLIFGAGQKIKKDPNLFYTVCFTLSYK